MTRVRIPLGSFLNKSLVIGQESVSGDFFKNDSEGETWFPPSACPRAALCDTSGRTASALNPLPKLNMFYRGNEGNPLFPEPFFSRGGIATGVAIFIYFVSPEERAAPQRDSKRARRRPTGGKAHSCAPAARMPDPEPRS